MPTFFTKPDFDDDNFDEDGDLLEPTEGEIDRAFEKELDSLPDDDHMEEEKSVSSIHLNEEEVRLKKLGMAIDIVRNHGSDVNVFAEDGFNRSDPDRKQFSETLIKDREIALSAAYNFITKEFNRGLPGTLLVEYNDAS